MKGMVSTRGVRYKFSEGERVLCYEPDPTKAKVLYDSKVLEVIENKDKRGRRTVEYLIHFQGWNSSWDRCVSEDFVLKDTAENRQLQRELAEKSQLQLGAYLYRRERKKGGSAGSAGPAAKRARLGLSDDGSSSSTQPEGEGVEGGCEDTDSSLGSGSHSSSQPRSPPAHHGRANIPLPNALRDRLTFDYHLVVKRGRLSCLPASPSAAEILESFVKWFARAGAWHPPRSRHDPPQKPDLVEVSCKLNLVREIADGLRVYFDFILRTHLLYRQEHDQYRSLCGMHLHRPDELKTEPSLDNIKAEKDLTNNNKEGPVKKEMLITYFKKEPEEQEVDLAAAEQDIKSPKMPEYSHLPPDPEEIVKVEVPVSTIVPEAPVKSEPADKPPPVKIEREAKMEFTAEDKPNSPAHKHGQHKEQKENRPSTRSGNLARRLRSHKSSAVSPSENEVPAPSTSTVDTKPCETHSSSVGSSGSSLTSQSEWRGPPAATPAPQPHTRTPLSQLLDGVSKWEILPREGTEHLPSRVYGAIHLARLFVKLPDFLNATQMQDLKLKMILKHIDKFVQYLEEHEEWFGESHYIINSTSRSH